MQKILLLFSFITSSLFSMELVQKPNKICIDSSSMFVPNQLGDLKLYHGKKGFYINKDDEKHHIKKYFTDPIIRDMTKTQLTSFLKQGYLSVNRMDDGEYSLKAKMRLKGGGPILGVAAYWTTKCLCYGVIAAGIAASMGGAGLAVTGNGIVTSNAKERMINAAQDVSVEGAKIVLGGVAATATVPLVFNTSISSTSLTLSSMMGSKIIAGTGVKVISTAAMSGGAYQASGLVATAITGAGLGQEAALLTTAGMASTTGTGLGVVGTIELISLKVGLFFGMAPTP